MNVAPINVALEGEIRTGEGVLKRMIKQVADQLITAIDVAELWQDKSYGE